jgi:hypothetical protein
MARFVLWFVPVRFFHSYVFSTTSPLRFSVRSGSFLNHFSLESAISPVRFSKKVFFFIFGCPKQAKKSVFYPNAHPWCCASCLPLIHESPRPALALRGRQPPRAQK